MSDIEKEKKQAQNDEQSRSKDRNEYPLMHVYACEVKWIGAECVLKCFVMLAISSQVVTKPNCNQCI